MLFKNSLIKKGFKRGLIRQDMWEIDSSESSEVVTNKLEKEWNKTMTKFRQKHGNDTTGGNKNVTAIYKTNTRNNEEELILNVRRHTFLRNSKIKFSCHVFLFDLKGVSEIDIKIASTCAPEPSLILCLIKVFGGKFLAGTFLKLVQDLLGFCSPILLE